AMHVISRFARYDVLSNVLRDPTGIADETTDAVRQSSVAEETAESLCDAAETDYRALNLIASLLEDVNFRPAWGGAVRCAATRHIPSARERALALIDDGDKDIQWSAFFALHDVATDADCPRLLGILKDRDASRRYHAAWVLERLTGPKVLETLDRAARE